MTFRALFRTSGLAIFLALVGASAATKKVSPELASVDRKIARLESNGRAAHPSANPTVLTEVEINGYLASDEVEMPAGVQSVRLSGTSGTVSGTARIDFDKVRAGTNSSNPLLSIFSGIHEVAVGTHAYGRGGQGYVHVDSVSLDGIEVPHIVLELFVEKYLTPRYPQIGMDSRFALPDRIDTAVVGQHQVTLMQK